MFSPQLTLQILIVIYSRDGSIKNMGTALLTVAFTRGIYRLIVSSTVLVGLWERDSACTRRILTNRKLLADSESCH